jgi:putative nucleotidyltransferase with HDIG domain
MNESIIRRVGLTKQTGKTDKRGKRIFYILMLVVFFWFIATQLLGDSGQSRAMSQADYVYQGQILWEKPDGSSEPITVPGKYDVAENETMVLTLQLPESYIEQNLMIRSSLQDIRFYVDGKLRIEYDTSDTRIIGKNSASQYVFCPTSAADAGKEVRIELTTHTGKYAGVVNEIYCGDKSELWEYIFEKYGITMIIAFFLLFAGAVTIIFSIALGIVYHSKFDMEYLGWCILLAAAWMIGESKLRQLLVPNASALSQLCFLMIMLGPLPIIYYIDSIQNKRHWKLLRWMEYVTILDFVVCCMLHLTGMVDFIQTLPVSQGILAVILILVTGTVCYDLYHGYIRKNRYILVGLFVAVASVVVESLAVYFVVSISGIFIGIGMLVLFFVNLVRTISQVRDLERTRQQQELRKRRKQMETMSLQMIQTLATTIEAKDEYTRGHSHRVAEYSVLIAKELGWKQKDIFHLYNAAHLHDIGNIGIPDAILNKPARLTDEEYAVIKEHTIIGAEILKNITLVKHVVEVARSHHECYDGTGYPDGLKGEEIPIQARIVAVADSYDAMRSRRIYRNTLKSEVIYEQFQKNRGVQFDPEITDTFLRLLDEGRLVIEEEYAGANVEYGLTEAETEIEKFITNVISTMCTQEDSEGFDFLTGLPMRNRGEKLAAQFMQRYSGFLVFLDMDNLKKLMISMDIKPVTGH